ncbi:MAG TPA: class I SAM-dependent methyltransferase [Actinocatenispora sp.]
MEIELAPPYQDLTFMSPLSEDRAARLVRFLADGLDGVVVDVGCGWAELLLRVVEAAPKATGLGLDLDADAVGHGRRLAERRGLDQRVRLVVGNARDELPARVDAAICIGATQVWGEEGRTDLPIDYRSALRALRSAVEPGGRVVYGEGVWSAEPTEAAAAPLAGRLDEFVRLPELLDLAVAEGFRPVQVHEATLDEWDEFESGYSACYARWLATHPADHPHADEVRRRADRQRAAYLRGYRGVLGLAYLGLLAV